MKMLTLLKVAGVLVGALAVSACGQKVEVPTAHVGKIMTQNGYKEGIVHTSRFHLDPCMTGHCDKLILLDASDKSVEVPMKLFMPKDKLNLDFVVQLTLAVDPNEYEMIFAKIPPTETRNGDVLEWAKIYQTYASQIIKSEAREFMSTFSIGEITSNLEVINAQLSDKLATSIQKKTPFIVRYAGLSSIEYPEIITKAQENSAQRREMIAQEEAQLEVSRVQLERQLKEQQLQRAIDVEKAEAEAEVNRILANSMTPEYRTYRSLNIMEKMADSDNKVFVPSGMLDSVAGQVALGNTR